MFCSKCGVQGANQDQFCHNCGAQIEVLKQPPFGAKQKNNATVKTIDIWAILGGIF